MRTLIILLLCIPAVSHALKCKKYGHIWTPNDQLPPQALIIADAGYATEIESLMKADVHFLADGARVDAKVEQLGTQATIRPVKDLSGTVKLAGLPKAHWPQDLEWKVVERKLKTPQWDGEPKLVDKGEAQRGKWGFTWSRTYAVPVVGSRIVVVKGTHEGKEVVRYYQVEDGKFVFRDGLCHANTPLPAGTHQLSVAPVDKNGMVIESKPITLNVPKAP